MDDSTSGRCEWGNAVGIAILCKFVVIICLFLSIIPSVFGVIEIESIEFGFDGFYKRGRWVPLQLLVVSENEHDSFVGELEVTVTSLFSGAISQTYSTPVSLTRTDRRRYTLHVFQPGTSTKLTLRIVHHEGRIRVEREIIPDLPKEPKDLFILALTPPGRDVLDDWHGLQIDASAETRAFVVHPASQKHLPLDWIGYDSIDLVVLRGVSLKENRISPTQQISLLDWVRNGGTLLISGGDNLQYLRDSFLTPLLPVYLGELKTAIYLPEALAPMGMHSDFPINIIDFKLKDNAEVLRIGGDSTHNHGSHPILASRRQFGSGQIVCLAFDYNVLPLSQSVENEQIWTQFLNTIGKSSRHLDDRYEPYRRDTEKIHATLKSLASERAPLLRLLFLFLLACLLGIGGYTWWVGKDARRTKHYWIGSLLITVFFSCAAVLPRHLLSIPVSVSRYSILSVYLQGSRAHLQTYIGAIASADSKSSVRLDGGTYITPLTQTSASPLHLVESKSSRICQTNLSAWQTRTYSVESFFDVPVPPSKTEWASASKHDKKLSRVEHHLPGDLESAGVV
ncbi:MAG: hypothetical protein OXT74_04590, partial [Candidatus Poribacteria bacterium]|nr:hypothetical protein [Candidatus Poribacteria bacterium]